MGTQTMIAGQRWVSDSEPELGLGMLLKAEGARVEVLFPAVEETRVYAVESAPLRRVEFREGDSIETHEGVEHLVKSSCETNGLIVYQTDLGEVAEAELSDSIGFLKPEDRLYGGQVDEDIVHALRVEALQMNCELKRSVVRGFVGGKIDLIPHQLGIAYEVASRLRPRVLLADEVGLGKTIEACLIMHRMHLTGRAERVLIIVPEPLINQWFVELLRKFNLLFSVFDEARCVAIEAQEEGLNPFLDSQLVICSSATLTGNPARKEQVVTAGWDLLIVDEAHHLEWSEEESSEDYAVVEALASEVVGLLLLTATPEQLGPEGHFARLRLLDPIRFSNISQFQQESERYERIAELIDQVNTQQEITAEAWEKAGIKGGLMEERASAWTSGDKTQGKELVSELLDCFGTGRVMFRNTREQLQGFPKRVPHLYEIVDDTIDWLVDLLLELGDEKVLLICESQEMVEQIAEGIRERVQINVAVFHEELSLIKRDRNAAYFAEEDGARILLCSEIGSEGRNFQFVHHLVLYDLPMNPELLEQRIGRLDRIGQTEDIQLHIPYQKGTRGEVLARWYNEGLSAFSHNISGAADILELIGDDFVSVLSGDGDLEKLIQLTRSVANQISSKLKKGHDKLLELNSDLSEHAALVMEGIDAADKDKKFEGFLIRLLDVLGLAVSDLENRCYLLKQGNVVTSAFPNIPEDGLSVTFDRNKALSRDELTLLTSDHPIARAALDTILGTELGNSNFNVWEDESGVKQMVLEAEVVVEVLAPAALEIDRFLPTTPIRVVVDHQGRNLTDTLDFTELELRAGGVRKLMSKPVVKLQVVPKMLAHIHQEAGGVMNKLVAAAKRQLKKTMNLEIARLTMLSEKNDVVSEDEIRELEVLRDQITVAMESARLRTDTLRLIWRQ